MLTGTQTLPKVTLLPISLEISSMPQLLDDSKLLETRTSPPAVLPTYAESDYHWLIGVLDALIEFMRRDENHSVPELTEDDYDWAHALLVELVGAVGENEMHPLRPLMEFVRQLIDNYEDKYVPELTELFPELAEETPIETASKSKQPASNIPKQNESELAAHAFFSIGFLLYHGNWTEKAISAYDTAIVLKPDFWEASYNLGIVRYDFRQYAEAIVNLSRAIELNHKFASAYYNRGILKSELKDYEGAIADFDKAIVLGFNSAEVYCHRASAKTLLRQHDAAVSDYDKVIELKPDFIVEAYNIRGILRSELGQHDEALADYTEAIRINSDCAEAYGYRGVAKAELGNIDEARSDLQTALELAEQQENDDFKALVENGLRRLEQIDSKQKRDKQPRHGGQWKGKVKIAEDFDELPESFMSVFHEDKE